MRTIPITSLARLTLPDGKAIYCLTDSRDLVDMRIMTPDDADRANQRAHEATDGNWEWLRVETSV